MKNRKALPLCICLMFTTLFAYCQDGRTLETKVADILSLFPASTLSHTDQLINNILMLGEEGITIICNQIIPCGRGDDTRSRYAIESLSRYLSQSGKETDKKNWENICIKYALKSNDRTVKDFFLNQLHLIGSEASVEALKPYLFDTECFKSVLSVLTSIGGETVELVLSASIKNREIPCPASVLNILAQMRSQIPIDDYIFWSSQSNAEIKAAAYNALAQSGSPRVLSILLKASKKAGYNWDHFGSVNSLLNYAIITGEKGDLKTMNKICNLLISKCKDESNIHYKIAALNTYVNYHGFAAMPYLQKAVNSTDEKYRKAALRMTLSIQDDKVVSEWISYYKKAPYYSKADIISMLGQKGDHKAIPLIKASLSNSDVNVRKEAAIALAVLAKKEALPDLIEYMLKYTSQDDQSAASTAIKITTGGEEIIQLLPVLEKGHEEAQLTAIKLFTWYKEQKFFEKILPFTSSENELIKSAAFKALAELSGPYDQKQLIELITNLDNPDHIKDIQTALHASAKQITNPELRSSLILKALVIKGNKEKLIPVLAKTGGSEALQFVLKEFQNGNPEIRELCLRTLTEWGDYSAASALFEVLNSGDIIFENMAFTGYINQISTAPVSDEQKLIFIKKIIPFAQTTERKNNILTETGKLKTISALRLVAGYFEDPKTSASAAKAAINIALPTGNSKTGLYGNEVIEILSRAIPLLEAYESSYNKERLIRYIETISLNKDSNLAPEEKNEGFISLFNGINLDNWIGNKTSYIVEDHMIVIQPVKGSGGNLFTEKEYTDFIFRFEFQLTPGANNGLGIRTPLKGDPAYVGMEIQILDDSDPIYANLEPYQYHGSVYGVIPAKRGYLKPVGEWNYQEVKARGSKIKVILNGEIIVDGDVSFPAKEGTMDKRNHPGLSNTTGHIGFLGHGSVVRFRNIRIKEL